MDSTTIGIDLGTTYSCVGVFQHGKVEIIANDYGNRTTPSCVAFTDTERLVGEVARSQATRNPENTVFEIKRLMGRTFDDPKVQEDIKNWPFKVRDDCGQPKVVVEYKGEVKKFTAQEISSMILMKMKSTAEAYLGTEVKQAVITVPAYFNDSQRQATKDAAKIAGLEVKRIINEPTAAALAYGLDKKLSGEQNVLVFDLGGGTFDVSILSIADGSTFEVLSTAGDTHLGGGDLDNRMVKYFADEFKRKFKVDPTTSPRAIRKLKMACEQAKRALSSTSVATVEIDSFFEGIYFFSKITRARFEELCIDLFKQTLEPVKQALADAGLKKSDIHEVVLVGGSTRIPKVQNLLEDFFDGRTISKSINPDEAVAYGASVQATILSENPTDAFNDVLLIDVVPLSLGTDVGKHSMATIIERNTRIPVTKSQSFSTGRDYQTAVHVGVYQGERALVKDNHMLGEFVFDGLRSARLGEVSVNVEFSVDTDGILNVSAKEMQTGKVMTKTISNDKSRLSQREIERMLQEAQMFQEEDNARRQAVAALQEFEQYVYSAGRTVEESGGGLSDDERRTVFQLTGEAQRWMDSNTLAERDEIQHRFGELREQLEPLLNKTRQQPSGETHPASEAQGNREREGSPRRARDASPSGSRDGRRDEPESRSREGSPHGSQHGSRKGSRDRPRESRGGSNDGSQKESRKGARKGRPDSPRDGSKDKSQSGSRHGSRHGSQDSGSRDGSRDGSKKKSRKGTRKGHRDSSRDGSQDGAREKRDKRRDRSRTGSREGSRDGSQYGRRDGSREESRSSSLDRRGDEKRGGRKKGSKSRKGSRDRSRERGSHDRSRDGSLKDSRKGTRKGRREGSRDGSRDESQEGSRERPRKEKRDKRRNRSRDGSRNESRDKREKQRDGRRSESRGDSHDRHRDRRERKRDVSREGSRDDSRERRRKERKDKRKDKRRSKSRDESRDKRREGKRDGKRDGKREGKRRSSVERPSSLGPESDSGEATRQDSKDRNERDEGGRPDSLLQDLLGRRRAPRASNLGLRGGLRGKWALPDDLSPERETTKPYTTVDDQVD
ncbi:heat shock protein 70 A2-like [Amphibalanus amphitrite]|uniref:heat shock protein 70 A2-like n=1 Tax=Amphibalanus amphitrite TaxID=1232801 RepID=UPI001C8FAA4B|nr:heat shock protein 70 A2-like [Amphibalanus amphitrite]